MVDVRQLSTQVILSPFEGNLDVEFRLYSTAMRFHKGNESIRFDGFRN